MGIFRRAIVLPLFEFKEKTIQINGVSQVTVSFIGMTEGLPLFYRGSLLDKEVLVSLSFFPTIHGACLFQFRWSFIQSCAKANGNLRVKR